MSTRARIGMLLIVHGALLAGIGVGGVVLAFQATSSRPHLLGRAHDGGAVRGAADRDAGGASRAAVTIPESLTEWR